MSIKKKNFFILVGITSFAGLAAIAGTLLLWFEPAFAATETTKTVVEPGVVQWGFLAAAVSTGLSALGAGIAVGGVGAAAIGAIAEKPELLGRTLILVGLAEGIAIYGIIISILILNKVL